MGVYGECVVRMICIFQSYIYHIWIFKSQRVRIQQNKYITQYGFHVIYDSEDILLLTSSYFKVLCKDTKELKKNLVLAFFF